MCKRGSNDVQTFVFLTFVPVPANVRPRVPVFARANRSPRNPTHRAPQHFGPLLKSRIYCWDESDLVHAGGKIAMDFHF